MASVKKNIALVAGGNSSEWVVSVNSAREVKKMIDPEKFNCFIVFIRKEEAYVQITEDEKIPLQRADFSFTHAGEMVQFDFAYIMIHGTPGEDGILQGYFEFTGLPYSGCGVLSSAVTFDKEATKDILRNYGITMASAVLAKKLHPPSAKDIAGVTGLPCFVKPNKGGSSFGVTKVKSIEMLDAAIELAFSEDEEVLIEEYIEGIELTCGLFKSGHEDLVFPVTEIVSKNEFFDFEAKYTTGMADEITPARVPADVSKLCQDTASRIYDILDCRGIVRIDFIYKERKLYFLEVNTVPGMSANSIVPQQIRAMGLTEREVLTKVIESALPA